LDLIKEQERVDKDRTEGDSHFLTCDKIKIQRGGEKKLPGNKKFVD